MQFAVFQDGSFLVSGSSFSAEGAVPFTAIFDRGGSWIKDVALSGEAAPLATQERAVSPGQGEVSPGSAAAAGPKGSELPRGRVRPSPALTVGAGFSLVGPD